MCACERGGSCRGEKSLEAGKRCLEDSLEAHGVFQTKDVAWRSLKSGE